jgi:hypothetical protein
VAGARVPISYTPPLKFRVPAPPAITAPLVAAIVADPDGSFHAGSLVPCQYIACAEAAAPGLLDPRHWSAAAPVFTVSAGRTISGVKIVMTKESVLRVRYSAPIQSSAAAVRDVAITVPFDTPVDPRVLRPHVTVSD